MKCRSKFSTLLLLCKHSSCNGRDGTTRRLTALQGETEVAPFLLRGNVSVRVDRNWMGFPPRGPGRRGAEVAAAGKNQGKKSPCLRTQWRLALPSHQPLHLDLESVEPKWFKLWLLHDFMTSCRNVQVERRSELSPCSWQRHWAVYLQIPPRCTISIWRSLSWYNLPWNIYFLLHEVVNFKWKPAESKQFMYFNDNVYKYIKYISFMAVFTNTLVCLYICTHSRQNISLRLLKTNAGYCASSKFLCVFLVMKIQWCMSVKTI